MSERFPAAEFDQWAATYDQSVRSGGFPFEGYRRMLHTIFDLADVKRRAAILDLGVGTGNLAQLFADQGCELWGLDYSARMLARAQAKLPGAHLMQADLQGEWPPELARRFDCIVSAYVFHHFPLVEKIDLIKGLIEQHLAPGGRLLIGDIAFADQAAEDAVRRSTGNEWEQEDYWLVDQALPALASAGLQVEYREISYCAGVFEFFT